MMNQKTASNNMYQVKLTKGYPMPSLKTAFFLISLFLSLTVFTNLSHGQSKKSKSNNTAQSIKDYFTKQSALKGFASIHRKGLILLRSSNTQILRDWLLAKDTKLLLRFYSALLLARGNQRNTLQSALNSKSASTQEAAAFGLSFIGSHQGSISSQQILGTLVNRLSNSSKDSVVRQLSLAIGGFSVETLQKVKPSLLDYFRNTKKDPIARGYLTIAISKLAAKDATLIDELRKQLNAPSHFIKITAAQALGRLGPTASTALATLQQSTTVWFTQFKKALAKEQKVHNIASCNKDACLLPKTNETAQLVVTFAIASLNIGQSDNMCGVLEYVLKSRKFIPWNERYNAIKNYWRCKKKSIELLKRITSSNFSTKMGKEVYLESIFAIESLGALASFHREKSFPNYASSISTAIKSSMDDFQRYHPFSAQGNNTLMSEMFLRTVVFSFGKIYSTSTIEPKSIINELYKLYRLTHSAFVKNAIATVLSTFKDDRAVLRKAENCLKSTLQQNKKKKNSQLDQQLSLRIYRHSGKVDLLMKCYANHSNSQTKQYAYHLLKSLKLNRHTLVRYFESDALRDVAAKLLAESIVQSKDRVFQRSQTRFLLTKLHKDETWRTIKGTLSVLDKLSKNITIENPAKNLFLILQRSDRNFNMYAKLIIKNMIQQEIKASKSTQRVFFQKILSFIKVSTFKESNRLDLAFFVSQVLRSFQAKDMYEKLSETFIPLLGDSRWQFACKALKQIGIVSKETIKKYLQKKHPFKDKKVRSCTEKVFSFSYKEPALKKRLVLILSKIIDYNKPQKPKPGDKDNPQKPKPDNSLYQKALKLQQRLNKQKSKGSTK